jgi:hypothetical protein
MKTETIVTGYSRGLNRWHDETGAFHAMHDKPEGVYTFSVPLCGAKPHSFGGHQTLNTYNLCRTCAVIMQGRIRHGMARAFFACAWADQCEETGNGRILSGKEITEIMPRAIDPAAEHAAKTLHFDMERVNVINGVHQFLPILYAMNPGKPRLSLESWGHYAAMESMGHGVGLWEYEINEPDVTVPYVEFGSYSLERDYFKQSEGAKS